MRRTLWIPLSAFAITLAVLLGQRLSTDALAVILGVSIGVAAGLPGHLLLFKLTRPDRAPAAPLPPPTALHLSAPPALPVPRSFVVVGEEVRDLRSPIVR